MIAITTINHTIYRISIGNSLVGGFNPSEKYEFVSWDDFPFPIERKVKVIQNSVVPVTTNQYYHWIGLREILQETTIFHGKNP